MTHYEPDTVERTALPDTIDALGVDGDGRTHFVTTPVGGLTIYVETSDGFDRFELEDMPLQNLEQWIDHVGTLRGWNEICYTESFGDHLVDTLEEAV